jgi:D-alanyl-D-alanine carboxypeptidase (penicillin-binding protein 5/6)
LNRSAVGGRRGWSLPALLALLLAVGALPAGAAGPAEAGHAPGPRRAATTRSLPVPTPVPVRVVPPPRVSAASFLLADAVTGQTLLARSASAPRPMASTTKVMTALLVLERLDLDRSVTIGPGPAAVGEESLRLRVGERLTVRQLLQGLLLKSANDAAVALAEVVDGSEAAFVRRMNARARALGLRATGYATPHGLDRPGHATSARDLARLWSVAMRLRAFRALVATEAARLPGAAASRRFESSNQLLLSYPWTLGGKTGFTDRAGRCLVASAERGGRRLVAVALGSPDAFRDVQALFEFGFTAFVRARLAQAGQTVSLPGGAGTPTATVAAAVDALVRPAQLGRLSVGSSERPGGPARSAAPLLAGGQPVATLTLRPAPPGASPQPLRARPLPPGAVPRTVDRFLVAAVSRG